MRNAVLLAAGTCVAGLASAQAADTAERMERARREAANPLRMIIEAGQAKGRARPVEAAPRPRPAAEPTPAPAAPAPVAPAPAPSPIVERVEALPAPTPAPTPAPPPPTATPAPTVPSATQSDPPVAATPTDAIAPSPAGAASSTMPPTAQAAVAPPLPAAPAPAVVAPVPLRLVNYVAPELTPRVLARLGRTNVVNALLRINADGSVAEVDLRGNVDRALGALVVEALRQWRYAPLEAPREQLVELVIKPED